MLPICLKAFVYAFVLVTRSQAKPTDVVQPVNGFEVNTQPEPEFYCTFFYINFHHYSSLLDSFLLIIIAIAIGIGIEIWI